MRLKEIKISCKSRTESTRKLPIASKSSNLTSSTIEGIGKAAGNETELIGQEIENKNKELNSLSFTRQKDLEKIKKTKQELDRLLYTYYKSIINKNVVRAFL